MSLVDNYQARKSIVAWLKDNATIVATVNTEDDIEIREKDWQGEKFKYNNIRVTCSAAPTECDKTDIDAIISYFSESKSSKQAIESQGIIAKEFHRKDFTKEGIKMSAITVTNLPDAEQVSEGVWKADVIVSMIASEVV